MKIVEARVLSVLKLQPYRIRSGSAAKNEDPIPTVWRMCLSYPGAHTVFEVELREPLKSLASKKYTVGLNGMVEFDMFSSYVPTERVNLKMPIIAQCFAISESNRKPTKRV